MLVGNRRYQGALSKLFMKKRKETLKRIVDSYDVTPK